MKTLALLLLSAVSLRADTLADVKSAVAALRGTQPIRASAEIHRKDHDAGRFSNDNYEGTATVQVGLDASGVHLDFSSALVEQFAREQREFALNRKKIPTASRTAGGVTPLWALSRLNASDEFLGMLRTATPKSESRAMLQNHAARLLVFDVKEIVPDGVTSVGSVDYPVNRLRVWIGEDNLPMFAEHTVERDAKFMFIHARGKEVNTWTFARVSDHLVVMRYTSASSAEGFGQKGENQQSEVITIN
jgi:hypothetical protein